MDRDGTYPDENRLDVARRLYQAMCIQYPDRLIIFRRLKAYRLLPILRAALVAHATEHVATKEIEPKTDAA
jgi:hypothetical protein